MKWKFWQKEPPIQVVILPEAEESFQEFLAETGLSREEGFAQVAKWLEEDLGRPVSRKERR